VRFDDMLTTVMAAPQATAVERQIVWRQLVDILAQQRGDASPQLRREAFDWLTAKRAEIAPVVRASVARSVAPHTTAPDMVRYFGEDDPAIAAEMIRHARLTGAQWRELLPRLPAPSRGVLRARRDLPDTVDTALAAFGPSDFVLAGPPVVTETVPPTPGVTPIADIVARIEAFRAQKEHSDVSVMPRADANQFSYETDAEGVITFVAGVAREAVIGLNIASVGDDRLNGVDGYAAGAFRGRSSFSGARLHIAGRGPTAGDWSIEGEPIFEHARGVFLGYRGSARRPLPNERAPSPASQAPQADGLRQLVHELRTPLNAILGFAEMIEREMIGPVSEPYRTRAAQIMADGSRLVSAIEDIDLAARLDTHGLDFSAARMTDIAAMLTVVGREMKPLTDARRVHLRVVRPTGPLAVYGDETALHRLTARLIGMMLGVADAEETLTVAAQGNHDQILISVDRPKRLRGQSEAELMAFNDEAAVETANAPLLGLGFGLRLIESLARATNVKMVIEASQFVLILAASHDSANTTQGITPHHDEERLPN